MTTYRTVWYSARADHLTKVAPAQAGAAAAQGAARAAAGGIGGTGSGALAGEVGIARPVAALTWMVGSSLPYARIEHYGGTIRGNPYLYIHGDSTSSYSTRTGPGIGLRAGSAAAVSSLSRGSITAVVTEVQHHGKHYFDRGLAAFPALFMARMKAMGG